MESMRKRERAGLIVPGGVLCFHTSDARRPWKQGRRYASILRPPVLTAGKNLYTAYPATRPISS
ncbi:hypothetical protein GGE35_005514 [Rhizobium cellulosilyticum]|uniref:Uncharacterized protein n=1 Tax=Aliirhizobium cellulosilyticum TaxID=393664 RepID=A0A7W6TLH3_9HYPH|nr:hypothetical protein [Rhizobium cellulosilyticum]MBB4415013.1 hypothetical protein [Rhizobium cellulosilyticum]MBB4449657.1 hypothetical protein [Rhizobium cellulosilyticum]